VWYEIERYEQPFTTNADCVTATYGERDATSITVVNRAKFLVNGTGTIATGVGALAYPELDPMPGRLNVSFFGRKLNPMCLSSPSLSLSFPATLENNYQILDTDYTHFSFVYNCVNQPGGKSYQSYWLLSRTPQLTTDEEPVATINCLRKKFIDPSQVRTADQSEESCSKEVEYVDLSKYFTGRPKIPFKRPAAPSDSSVEVSIVNY
jgi:apolipoprotein D and lipocalin family protein